MPFVRPSVLALLLTFVLAARCSAQPPGPIVSDEAPPTHSVLSRIDEHFQSLVGWLTEVLLYRVGAPIEQFVLKDHVEIYVRNSGSSGPFVAVDPQSFSPKQIPLSEAETLLGAGKLVPGHDANGKERPYRAGRSGNLLVEYLTINVDTTSKYVLVPDGAFHKVGPKRRLLSDKPGDILTREQVNELARLNQLKRAPVPPGERAIRPDYIFVAKSETQGFPLVVLWLVLAGLGFTIYLKGFNVRGFYHAIQVVRGRYDNVHEAGEVTHFQALASALSGTVGLGNIAGVTIAMTAGGPGAFFWMIVCGLLGMSSKFVECTLGVKYRLVKPDGTVQGGPMQYLREGLAPMGPGFATLGAVLAVVFSVMCVLGSIGGGNMFQANQSAAAVLAVLEQSQNQRLLELNQEIAQAVAAEDFARASKLESERREIRTAMSEYSAWFRPLYGVVLSVMVAVVILGGIRRIASASEKIVPLMCGTYILACLWIIAKEYARIPELAASIFSEAFSGAAVGGGVLGAAAIGMQRAAFSNEAGVGSAAIAHSAARTNEPVREGIVALLEPFIDTVVICSMTALVILITGAWDNDAWVVGLELKGSALTSQAFAHEISWFPAVLAVATLLFAYSTIISWSYYGERSWEHLFGARSTVLYKILSVLCVFLGAIVHLGSVMDFSDMMILSMAFPNVIGLFLLAPGVKRDLNDYWRRYRSGEFDTSK